MCRVKSKFVSSIPHKDKKNSYKTRTILMIKMFALLADTLKKNLKLIGKKRDKELKKICDKYRRNDGSYDILIPGSGGKDSVWVSHIMKHKYNMNPLTVTWAPHIYTKIGWLNFQNWVHSGFDN